MALDFPTTPSVGQKHPVPSIVGIPTYTWDGEKWTTVGGSTGTLDPATALPLINATPAVVGVASKYAREDHVHPTDTSRAAASAIPVAATGAEYIANLIGSGKMLTPGAAWAAAAAILVTAGTTFTPDFSAAIDFQMTLGSATCTLSNPTNAKVGQKGMIYLIQDATGNRAITTWGSAWKFPGGVKPSLSTAAGAGDAIAYVVLSSTTIYCTFSAGFA